MGLQNMRHVISIRDVVSDTVHQFAPTYHDYVLYSNGNSKVGLLLLHCVVRGHHQATS